MGRFRPDPPNLGLGSTSFGAGSTTSGVRVSRHPSTQPKGSTLRSLRATATNWGRARPTSRRCRPSLGRFRPSVAQLERNNACDATLIDVRAARRCKEGGSGVLYPAAPVHHRPPVLDVLSRATLATQSNREDVQPAAEQDFHHPALCEGSKAPPTRANLDPRGTSAAQRWSCAPLPTGCRVSNNPARESRHPRTDMGLKPGPSGHGDHVGAAFTATRANPWRNFASRATLADFPSGTGPAYISLGSTASRSTPARAGGGLQNT